MIKSDLLPKFIAWHLMVHPQTPWRFCVSVVLVLMIAVAIANKLKIKNGAKNPVVIFSIIFIIMEILPLGLDVIVDIIGRRTPLYEMALADAKASPEAQQAIGPDIQIGWPIDTVITVDEESGNAELKIPIRSHNTEGSIFVQGTKSRGSWKIDNVYFFGAGKTIAIKH